MNLSEYSSKELKTELESRELAEKGIQKPQQVDEPDLTALRKECQSYIDDLAKTGRPDVNWEYYVYKEAMKAIFGTDVFGFIRSVIK